MQVRKANTELTTFLYYCIASAQVLKCPSVQVCIELKNDLHIDLKVSKFSSVQVSKCPSVRRILISFHSEFFQGKSFAAAASHCALCGHSRVR